ncbi:hypothetical protein D3C76_1369460 [compost metagenome]
MVFAGQLAAHIAFYIGRIVGQGEDLGWADVGAQQVPVLGQATFYQVIAQQPELVHGEAMFRREFGAVVFVVDQR